MLRFNTQPPEGGWASSLMALIRVICFNTQPPEGGWYIRIASMIKVVMFQHTAARRRLVKQAIYERYGDPVSTHSRPKAAGHCRSIFHH